MKAMAGVNVIVIVVIAVVVLLAVLSFITNSTKQGGEDIKLKGDFNQQCASLSCGYLQSDIGGRTSELCRELWGESNVVTCIKSFCAKCADYAGISEQQANTALQKQTRESIRRLEEAK
ncbi:hypothetical protein CL614_02245 [archaeon]|nr:hypothetical protein [archaeon]|tara:strand:+ start:69 stop:425 length:357 start_codon:yes stop_codon:yes gene_type:complete